jgi:GNAT superfamily N-acetyltransferase
MQSIRFRPATPDDDYNLFLILEHAIAELVRSLGELEPTSIANPDALAKMWEERRSLYAHLGHTAVYAWVAEQDGKPVGYARSVAHEHLLELTELFVMPELQSRGIGRELLARAFPQDDHEYRMIIASPDLRALSRYIRGGVYPRFGIYYTYREPRDEPLHDAASATGLRIEQAADDGALEHLAAVDLELFGLRRDADHRWLASDRTRILYFRAGVCVGYGYTGRRNGPFALLHPEDAAVVLAHAESLAAQAGHEHFGLEVPTVNHAALAHLLQRGFHLDRFYATLLTNKPWGRFDGYIVTSPPFFY